MELGALVLFVSPFLRALAFIVFLVEPAQSFGTHLGRIPAKEDTSSFRNLSGLEFFRSWLSRSLPYCPSNIHDFPTTFVDILRSINLARVMFGSWDLPGKLDEPQTVS